MPRSKAQWHSHRASGMGEGGQGECLLLAEHLTEVVIWLGHTRKVGGCWWGAWSARTHSGSLARFQAERVTMKTPAHHLAMHPVDLGVMAAQPGITQNHWSGGTGGMVRPMLSPCRNTPRSPGSFHPESATKIQNSTEKSTTEWFPWWRDSRRIAVSQEWSGWTKTEFRLSNSVKDMASRLRWGLTTCAYASAFYEARHRRDHLFPR